MKRFPYCGSRIQYPLLRAESLAEKLEPSDSNDIQATFMAFSFNKFRENGVGPPIEQDEIVVIRSNAI